MRHVRFAAAERVETAAAWAPPAVLVVGGVASVPRPARGLPLIGLAAALALAVFFLYDRIPRWPPIVLGGGTSGIALALVVSAGGGRGALVTTVMARAGMTALLTFDYTGSTPIEDRCIRCGACVVRCPEHALAFENAQGQLVELETTRALTLSLLGRRTVASTDASAADATAPPSRN